MEDQVVSHTAPELCDPSVETQGALPLLVGSFRLLYSWVSPPVAQGREGGLTRTSLLQGQPPPFHAEPAFPPSLQPLQTCLIKKRRFDPDSFAFRPLGLMLHVCPPTHGKGAEKTVQMLARPMQTPAVQLHLYLVILPKKPAYPPCHVFDFLHERLTIEEILRQLLQKH